LAATFEDDAPRADLLRHAHPRGHRRAPRRDRMIE
jgi:hypothetical protein